MYTLAESMLLTRIILYSVLFNIFEQVRQTYSLPFSALGVEHTVLNRVRFAGGGTGRVPAVTRRFWQAWLSPCCRAESWAGSASPLQGWGSIFCRSQPHLSSSLGKAS